MKKKYIKEIYGSKECKLSWKKCWKTLGKESIGYDELIMKKRKTSNINAIYIESRNVVVIVLIIFKKINKK